MTEISLVARQLKDVLWNLSNTALLFYSNCNSPFKWGTQRSWIVGLSCFFYLFPSITLRNHCWFESQMWIIVTCMSVLSDFVFYGRRDTAWVRRIHLTDRWVASLALGIIFGIDVPGWFTISFTTGLSGLTILILAVMCKIKGFRAKSCSEFVLWHSLWHFVGGVGRTLQGFLEAQTILCTGQQKVMTTILENLVDHRISIVTGDGRLFVGTLKTFDQSTNIILADCQERVFCEESGVEFVQLGLYLIRGDTISLIGELDEEIDDSLDFSSVRAPPLQPIQHSRLM